MTGKEIIEKIERWFFRPKIQWLTIPLFLIFFIVPATAGFVSGWKTVAEFFNTLFLPHKTRLSISEKELIKDDEWGLIIDSFSSEELAIKAKEEFLVDYSKSGHTNQKGQLIWQNDIHVLRDPQEKGRWILAIDMYDGQSSREAIQVGVAEMIESEKAADVRGSPLESWLNGSAAYHFNKSDFEKVYGQITNLK